MTCSYRVLVKVNPMYAYLTTTGGCENRIYMKLEQFELYKDDSRLLYSETACPTTYMIHLIKMESFPMRIYNNYVSINRSIYINGSHKIPGEEGCQPLQPPGTSPLSTQDNIHKFISYIYKTEDTINIRTLNSLYNIVKYVIDSPYNLFHLSVSWKYHVTLNIQASDYMVS